MKQNQNSTVQKDFAKVRGEAKRGSLAVMKKHDLHSFHLDNWQLYEYMTALLDAATKQEYPPCSKLVALTSCPIVYRKKAASKAHKKGLRQVRDNMLKHPLIRGLDGTLKIQKSTWGRWSGMSLAAFTKELQQRLKIKVRLDNMAKQHLEEVQLLKERIKQLEADTITSPDEFKSTRHEQIIKCKGLGWTNKRIADELAVSISTVKRELAKLNN